MDVFVGRIPEMLQPRIGMTPPEQKRNEHGEVSDEIGFEASQEKTLLPGSAHQALPNRKDWKQPSP